MQPAEPFIFNRRNVNYVHGKKKRLSSFQLGIGSFIRIFGFGLAAPLMGAAAFYFLLAVPLITQLRIDQDYQTTRAMIVDRSLTSNWIEYAYEVDGVEYRASENASDALPLEISIRYSVQDPSLSYIEGETPFSSGSLPKTGSIIAGFLLFLFPIVDVWGRELRIRRLSRVGTILTGTLIAAGWESLGKRTVVNYLVHFYFMTPEGEQVELRYEITDRVTFPRRPVPLPGTPVLILYENKRRFMLL